MREFTIECSKCSNLISVAVEESVNATRNQNVKQRVIMKRIFEARCPKCQNIHFVSHPFLYRDDEKKILYVLANENTDVDAFVKKQNLRGNYKKQYNLRVVYTINQLVEKILLAEHNINDKTMEVLKLFFVMGERNAEIRNVYFEGIENNHIRLAVILNDQRQLTAYADIRGIERIEALNKKALNEKKSTWEAINVKWAMDFYNANEAEINRVGAILNEQVQRNREAIKEVLNKRKETKKEEVAKPKAKKKVAKKEEKKSETKTTKNTAAKKETKSTKKDEKKVATKTTAKKETKKSTKESTKKTAKKTVKEA